MIERMIATSQCETIRGHFSSYLDGVLSGVTMQQIASHLTECGECAAEFARWRTLQGTLASLGPIKPPADLALRLRVAISQQHARTPRYYLDRLIVLWQNSIEPLVLQASAGLAVALLLVGIGALLAAPEPLSARDEPLGMASNPRFLYSSIETEPDVIGDRGNPLVVKAYIDGMGRVYDFEIVSGADDVKTRTQLENLLIFSVFEPARVFGQPVRGVAVMSFSGVSVRA